jgi:Ca2+-transporting ATPase
VIDPACSVVFEAEVEEADVMQRPPRDPASPLLLPRRILWALLQGVIALAILAATLIGASRMGMPEGDLRALVFTSLVLINMGLILINRSLSASLVRAFLRPNRSLWLLLGGVSVLLGLALYWPPASRLFHFGRLHWDDLGVCAIAGAASLLVLEMIKARWFRNQATAAAAK